LFEGTVASIRNRLGVRRINLKTSSPDRLPVSPATVVGTDCTVYVSDTDQFAHDLVVSGTSFSDLEVRGVSLEEAFIALTDR